MSNRAVSSVLGGLFTIAILVTVVAAFFAAQQSFNARYQVGVREAEEHSRQMLLERFSITGQLDASSGKIVVSILNTGPDPVRIVAVFVDGTLVRDLTSAPETINALVTNLVTTGVTFNDVPVSIRVLSERGNVASTVYPIPAPPGGNGELGASYVGPLKMNFDAFNYYKIGSAPGNKIDNVVLGSVQGAYAIDTASLDGDYIVFSVDIRNRDQDKRTIVLDQFSALHDTKVGVGSSTKTWFLITVDAAGDLVPLQDVTIKYDETVRIYFGSGSPGSQDAVKAFAPGTEALVNLVFHGTIAGKEWSQNSPFVVSLFE